MFVYFSARLAQFGNNSESPKLASIPVYLHDILIPIMESNLVESVTNASVSESPAEEITPCLDTDARVVNQTQNVLLHANELSSSRAGMCVFANVDCSEKIVDPERVSREFISNGLTGCHMEDVLQEKASQFIQKGRQIIILTAAGKPVYCYGRDEDDLSSMCFLSWFHVDVTAVIQALDANFCSMKETLK